MHKNPYHWQLTLNDKYPFQLTLELDSIDRRIADDLSIDLLRFGVKSNFKEAELRILGGRESHLDWYRCIPNIPIVSEPMWKLISPLVEDDLLELIPCKIDGIDGQYFLLNLSTV